MRTAATAIIGGGRHIEGCGCWERRWGGVLLLLLWVSFDGKYWGGVGEEEDEEDDEDEESKWAWYSWVL